MKVKVGTRLRHRGWPKDHEYIVAYIGDYKVGVINLTSGISEQCGIVNDFNNLTKEECDKIVFPLLPPGEIYRDDILVLNGDKWEVLYIRDAWRNRGNV